MINYSENILYIHFEKLDSTNDWVKRHIDQLNPDRLTCITALEQTAGRGRFKRKWLSPKGENLYATLFFTVKERSPLVGNLGQILSLACIDVLEKAGFSAQIKWPNDILILEKKVAGVLTETVSLGGRQGIILGIGLNVDTPQSDLDALDQPATSLSAIRQESMRFDELLEPLVIKFSNYLNLLQEHGFSHFRDRYESLLAFKGKRLQFHDGVRKFEGICHSIDAEGRVNVLLESSPQENEMIAISQITSLYSGEIVTPE